MPALALLMLLSLTAADTGRVTSGWSAPDGTELLLVQDRRVGLVTVRLEFPLGEWTSCAAGRRAVEGFLGQRHDRARRIRADLDRLGVELRLRATPRATRLEATFLREDLDAVVERLARMLAQSELDGRELRRRRREARLERRLRWTDPFWLARRRQARLLFRPGDPRLLEYGERRGRRVTATRLAAARDRLLRLPGRSAGFAGDLGRAEAEAIVAALLPPPESEPLCDPPLRPSLPLRTEGPGSVDVRLGKLTQVYFRYGRPSPSFEDDDYPAFLVADHVLGGHFHSRLYEALRHEGGETYGAWSESRGDTLSNVYALTTFTGIRRAVETERQLREVLARFHADGITESERATAVAFLRGRRAFGRQSPDGELARRMYERRLGLPAGWVDDVVEQAAGLDLAQVNEFIRGFYDPGRFRMIRVGPPG